MNYVIVCLVIGFILLVHETGHFVAAKAAGIPVERFSLGLGPRLWGFRRGGTDFCISLIPFGGYVLPAIDSEDAFFRIPPLKRICFSLGGPLANFLSVLPLLAVFNTVTGGLSIRGVIFHPFPQAIAYVERIVSSIPLLFSRPQQLSGVVGIVTEGGRAVSYGFEGVLALSVFLSINLAILNLLPVPALDGGQILMTLLEKLWPQSTRVRIHLSLFSWMLLMGIMVYATSKDISRLLG